MRHDCGNTGGSFGNKGWSMCIVCKGRLHLDGCTSKKNKHKDCCPARHKMLHDAGNVKGIADDSFFMWSEKYPFGWHPNDVKGGE